MERNFRGNLRDELNFQGLTVKELAAKASVAKGALDSYLGKQASMPPADAAIRIAKALDVSVEYLITGQDPPQRRSLSFLGHDIRLVVRILEKLPPDKRRIAAKAACAVVEALERSLD